jgi:hypothetical protein
MSSYNTRSRIYTVDYRIKAEKYKIGPTARRMKENNKNVEYTEFPGIAAYCAHSHSLRIFQHTPSSEAMCLRALPETEKISNDIHPLAHAAAPAIES